MLIQKNQFTGEIPRLNARYLPANAAQIAQDVHLDDGTISAMKQSEFVTDLETLKRTVYLRDGVWLAWSTDVNVVPGPTATDRLYITGDGLPKMLVDDLTFNLKLPPPWTAPTIETVGTPDAVTAASVVYAYTWVTEYDEESAPSPVSNVIETDAATTVRVSDIAVPPANRAIDRIRIYASETSSIGNTDLYFVAEIPVVTTYDHDPVGWPRVEPIPTTDHDRPPDDMRGLTAMPNGMMVAHTARELLFCEPYQPHAWPVKYRLTVDYDIVGLAAFGTQLAVLTKGTPYRGQGVEPASFALEKVEQNLPCVSKRGIVDLGYAAVYPSTEGLVSITSGGAQVISRALFTRRQWSALVPSSIVASHYDGRYVFGFSGSYPTGNGKAGIIDLSGEQPFLTRTNKALYSLYHDIRTGDLYWQGEGTRFLYRWAADDEVIGNVLWRSSITDAPFPIAFSVVIAEGEELEPGTAQIRIYADGTLLHTITELNVAKRLPVKKADEWEIEVAGKVRITSLALASSMQALTGRAL